MLCSRSQVQNMSLKFFLQFYFIIDLSKRKGKSFDCGKKKRFCSWWLKCNFLRSMDSLVFLILSVSACGSNQSGTSIEYKQTVREEKIICPHMTSTSALWMGKEPLLFQTWLRQVPLVGWQYKNSGKSVKSQHHLFQDVVCAFYLFP